MVLRLTLLVSLFVLYWVENLKAEGMKEIFKWKQIDYYEYGLAESDFPNSGRIYFPGKISNNASYSYIPYNNVPMGATHYKKRLFITVPRRRVGIPSTLNYIDIKKDGRQTSPKLRAYPDLKTNQLMSKDERIVSVYRTHVDMFGRMWFIDTGKLEYPDNPQQVQRPAIWVINLENDSILLRFEIPSSIVGEGQGLASITVDADLGYDATFAYIPDLLNNRLYVYSLSSNKIWSFSHNYFHFDPMAGDLNVGGQFFRWNDGIFSVSLGELNSDGTRNILFHAMASNNEFYVNNRVLQNESNAQRGDHGSDFKLLGSRGANKQSTMHAYDPKTNTIFYAEIHRNAVGCWNAHTDFTPANHGQVVQNNETMIYPSDLNIDKDGILWVMTNSMPIFIYSQLDPNRYNFRVWAQSTEKAVENAGCSF